MGVLCHPPQKTMGVPLSKNEGGIEKRWGWLGNPPRKTMGVGETLVARLGRTRGTLR